MFVYPLDNDLQLELVAPGTPTSCSRWSMPTVRICVGGIPGYATQEVADSRRALESMSRAHYETGCFHTLICKHGAAIGMVGFNAIDWANRYAKLGYWLAEQAQGRGVMTRACRVFVDHGFVALGLNRIEVHCVDSNRRSRAVAERLGFTLESVLRDRERLHGQFMNHAIYALQANERQPAAETPGRE